jgi:hypothetical protein
MTFDPINIEDLRRLLNTKCSFLMEHLFRKENGNKSKYNAHHKQKPNRNFDQGYRQPFKNSYSFPPKAYERNYRQTFRNPSGTFSEKRNSYYSNNFSNPSFNNRFENFSQNRNPSFSNRFENKEPYNRFDSDVSMRTVTQRNPFPTSHNLAYVEKDSRIAELEKELRELKLRSSQDNPSSQIDKDFCYGN